MKKTTLWVLVCLATVFLTGGLLAADKSLKIEEKPGAPLTAQVKMTSNEDVQGYVLSVAVDTTKVMVTDVKEAGVTISEDAELVVSEIVSEGFTLGVVMDFEPPYDGQVIEAGSNLLIAEADMESKISLACGESDTASVTFQDGLNDPPLSNLLVVDGSSIYKEDGLGLTGGEVTITGTCDTLRIVSAEDEAPMVAVTIEVDNQKPVEGYVIAIQNEAGPVLDSITTAGTDAASVGIEFEVAKFYPSQNGGSLGVVFDFESPYAGQVLEPDDEQSLAIFTYAYDMDPCPDAETIVKETFDLELVDNVLGSPLLSNVLVEDGLSKAPDKENGTVTFVCPPPVVPGEIDFWVGGEYAEDPNADNGCADPAVIEIPCAPGNAENGSKVSVYYTSGTKPIQGMSMALEFPKAISVKDLDGGGQGVVQDKHLDDTITEGLNAEFVSFNAGFNPVTDKGELIIGILVDSTPPVPLNHMYPPISCPGKVLNIFFKLPATADCGDTYALEFKNGLTGAGDVAISNRAAVFNESVPANTHNGAICVVGRATFIRGDCNTDDLVDIADPAKTMTYLFLGVDDPSCLDACDTNDDGLVDLADVCATLRYLFKQGPDPKPPFPLPGVDETPDVYGLDLGCESGSPCP